MIIIIGGAYQGKLDYAKEEFGLDESDIYHCDESYPADFGKKAVNGLHKYIWYTVCNGQELDYENIYEKLKDKIVICGDISAGIVPMEAQRRRWREETGRLMAFLCKRSDRVIRVFCGIGTVIK